MTRAEKTSQRVTAAQDRILTAAAVPDVDDRNAFTGHTVQAIADIGMQALAEALSADADQYGQPVDAAIAWAHARGLTDAIELLATHIAPIDENGDDQ